MTPQVSNLIAIGNDQKVLDEVREKRKELK